MRTIALLILTLLLACRQPATDPSATLANLPPDSLFYRFFEKDLLFRPDVGTRLGYNGFNNTWPDNLSDDYLDLRRKFLEEYREAMAKMPKRGLSEAEKQEFDILAYLLDIQLEGLALGMQPGTVYLYHPMHQYHRSTHHEFVKLAKGTGAQPFRNKYDYGNFYLRMKDFDRWLKRAQNRMRQAKDLGATLPREIVKQMIPQFDAWTVTDPTRNPFYFSLAEMPENISVEDSLLIRRVYHNYIADTLAPTFRRLQNFLEQEYLPQAREEDGLYAIPDGDKLYAWCIRYWTTTDMEPEEVFNLGLKEVARIRGEMDSIRQLVGFEGDLPDFFEHLKTDPRFFPFQTTEEVIDRHKQTLAIMQPELDRQFGLRPKADFEIRPVDPALARSATANYDGPSLDGSRPGIFYDAIPDPKAYNAIGMEALFLHEALPGHHFQIALDRENPDIPMYRKSTSFGAFVEGWALYCESLGGELGLYTDPYQYMGRLQMEMLRAVRLVVDPGLHYKGWSREEAITYLMDNLPYPEEEAITHIERYMVRPGQATCYKIGELKIKALRKKAEQVLGEEFDVVAFHDLILSGGSMPLKNLETRVDEWLAGKAD